MHKKSIEFRQDEYKSFVELLDGGSMGLSSLDTLEQTMHSSLSLFLLRQMSEPSMLDALKTILDIEQEFHVRAYAAARGMRALRWPDESSQQAQPVLLTINGKENFQRPQPEFLRHCWQGCTVYGLKRELLNGIRHDASVGCCGNIPVLS